MCPNWCTNTLGVHGKPEDVKKFMDDVKFVEVGEDFGMAAGETRELPLSFNAHLPTPDQSKFEGMDYKERSADPDYWHTWNVDNWGTKWDLNNETCVDVFVGGTETGLSTAIYNFDTAWSPPEAWLSHVAPLYPTLSFKLEYREEGMGFAGVLGFHKGSLVEDKTWECYYHSDVDTYEDIYG